VETYDINIRNEDKPMNVKNPKLPNPNAVAELRERSNKRKEERQKNYKEIAEVWKKKNPSKKDRQE
jgi:hypothetical protein